ncbi:hypothetical protein [Xanthovirga aplysinae]|uniref:hypothetical protein n=1 Tax=Xanthovirga aplysinae TaxID=2529853 RepID=UPI0012BC1C3F|nr:hypothetical protein [Xanthovirga aplysinae]MTI32628.1 hypothetical protein [Xanthovirga aplysinae]
MQNQKRCIAKCRRLIENKLAWGPSEHWQNQDFEMLSERIFEETKVKLSSSTLKRVWGKIRYDSTPNLSTLNVLAQFAGYQDWRTFSATIVEPGQMEEEKYSFEASPSKPVGKGGRKKYWLVGMALLVLLLALLWGFKKDTEPLTYSELIFKSSPVTLGLPNTVVFQYDASNSNADSVFIQQSWDSKRRFKVDKNKHEFTGTYYYPGFYRAKLILNDSIVNEHDLYIETEGWLGTLDEMPIPKYLSEEEIEKGDGIGISPQDLQLMGYDLKNEIPQLSLFNISKEREVPSDNFYFKTQLKSTFNQGQAVCQFVQIKLFAQNGVHLIPLSIKGCVGELGLIVGNEYQSGKTTDLSAFGVDFSDWVTVVCKVKDKQVEIFINNNLSFQGSFTDDIGPIVGYQFVFQGGGVLRETELKAL